jgi:hypothetical protein
MKRLFNLLLIAIMMQSFQCEDPNSNGTNISSSQLETKKQEIQNYINSFYCSEESGCGFIAFGSKPCGGPRTYLLYSNNVDLAKLQQMVKKYNELDDLYNKQTNAISDCMYQLPPTEVKCVNGLCTIIN